MPHTRDILQFIQGDGIGRRHRIKGRFLEDDVCGQTVLLGNLAPQVLEDAEQLAIDSAAATHMQFLVKHLGILVILDNPEFLTTAQERLAFLGHLDDAIVLDVLGEIIGKHTLPDNRHEELLVTFLGTAEDLQFVVLVALYLGRGVTHHHMGDIFGLEALPQGEYRINGGTQLLSRLDAFLGLEAVVAVATVVLIVGLAEVVQQGAPAAHRRLGIVARLEQQLFADFLLRYGLTLHEFLQLIQVLAGIEGDALAFAAITSRASRLLIIALKALGNVVVDDKSHIGLVNAHAEGDGRHNDVHILAEEGILVSTTHGTLHTGMVGQRLDVVEPQHLGEFLYLLAAQAIDDARLPFICLDKFDNLTIHVLGLGTNLIVKIGTIE